ncbi:MAG TPA: hypothetical protein VL242_32115 [Sorangium sp.]|nr:hypothetical protein [Sorangium sp.]
MELFKNRPRLAAEMLHDALGHPVPAFTAARVDADLTEIVPSNRRAYVIVVLLVGEQQRPAMAVVFGSTGM